MKDDLDRIYREHRQGLFSLALSITRNRDAAEDAIHDAFARLIRRDSSPTGDAIAYVFAAVRNAALDHLRRQPHLRFEPHSIFDEPMPGDEHTPIDALIASERERALREAIDALPDAQRQAVVMHIHGGLTFEQMAAATGEPMSTVASRYRRAISELRDQVETPL